MDIFKRVTILVLLLFAVFYYSCELENRKKDEIKIGYLAHPGYLPLFCADAEGYFSELDVKVKLVRFESSPAIVTALVNGDIDIAPMATASALSLESLDEGRFKVFALSSETVENYLTAVVAISDSIQRIEDLNGKKIGVFPGPAARALFKLTFEAYGLEEGIDIFFQELAPPLHIQALLSGEVAAIATYEPIATQAVLEINARKILPAAVESKVLSPTQGGSWLVDTKLVTEFPKDAEEVIGAIYKGIDFIQSNPDSLPNIVATYANVDLNTAKQAPIVTYSKLGDINIEAYQKHADLMLKSRVISKQIDVSSLLLSLKAIENIK